MFIIIIESSRGISYLIKSMNRLKSDERARDGKEREWLRVSSPLPGSNVTRCERVED
jgi:hypothetical protein